MLPIYSKRMQQRRLKYNFVFCLIAWLGFGFETGSHYIAQLDLKFIEICLALPPKNWYEPPYQAKVCF